MMLEKYEQRMQENDARRGCHRLRSEKKRKGCLVCGGKKSENVVGEESKTNLTI